MYVTHKFMVGGWRASHRKLFLIILTAIYLSN